MALVLTTSEVPSGGELVLRPRRPVALLHRELYRGLLGSDFSGYREAVIDGIAAHLSSDSLQTSTDKLVVIDSLPRQGLQVISPFYLSILSSPEDVIAHHADTGVFGVGDTESEAIEDFRYALLELYDELMRGGRDSLGPALLSVLDSLNAKLRRD